MYVVVPWNEVDGNLCLRHRPGRKVGVVLLAAVSTAVLTAACGGNGATAQGDGALSGRIESDGSSTVGPLAILAAEEFQLDNKDVRITVGISGSGGGFERFCNDEIDLSNASRPIKDEEAQVCTDNGVEFVEFRVATDALTVVVNPDNDFVDCLTTEQLSTIWAPEAEGEITKWNQVDPGFPDLSIALAGPGTDSGTFDYFTDEINGQEGASRPDYTATEDDNIVVQAVQGEKGGTGYLGFSYFVENPEAIKAVAIDDGTGCVAPSVETAIADEYPLARPLYVYAKVESFERAAVREFIRFFLENEMDLARFALYVPLSDEQLATAMADFEAALARVG